jgi:elongation factor Ts
MPEFTAADVARLRKLTGAGMMDCKQALTESDGDLEEASELLRKKGQAGAAKRQGRAADQGAVDVLVDEGVGAVVELNCETDFVAKGADFERTVAALARLAVEHRTADLGSLELEGGTVDDHIAQLGAKVGEKVTPGRVVVFESVDGVLDGYKHVQSGRGVIGVLIEVAGAEPGADVLDVAHELALHIASAAPRYVRREDVPADLLDKERAILEELTRNEGKPENAVSKIVEGRLQGFFKDQVLLEQAFVKDPKQTVAKVLGGLGPNAEVRRFARIRIGEE